jgi:hypothetical protein
MRRPNRVELYKRICKKIGIKPTSPLGYFSRQQMIEIDLYLQRVKAETEKLTKQKDAVPLCQQVKMD